MAALLPAQISAIGTPTRIQLNRNARDGVRDSAPPLLIAARQSFARDLLARAMSSAGAQKLSQDVCYPEYEAALKCELFLCALMPCVWR